MIVFFFFLLPQLLRCGRQLAEALRYLHEEAIPGRMVVHRDLKPDNIGFSAEVLHVDNENAGV